VGLGRIASILEDDPKREKPCTHAGAVAANRDCILAAGADIDEERRKLFAEKWKPLFPNLAVYADAEKMLAEQKPDILHIATHPDSHYHYCALAARYGVPVVVCEKPLADNFSEAKKIAALHSAEKITIITNHERRYSADYQYARKILRCEESLRLSSPAEDPNAEKTEQQSLLGAILGVKAVLYMGKTRRLLDVLWHDGTHLADAAMFLTDAELIHRKAFGAKLKSREGTAYLEGELMRTEFGARSSAQRSIPFLMELGAGRDHLVFELEISCERGRLRIGNGIFEIWESEESPYAEGFRSLAKSEKIKGFSGPTGYFSNMIEDAVACFSDKTKIPISGALDGLKVIEYLDAIKHWS
jgi:predicted dehydrogenase